MEADLEPGLAWMEMETVDGGIRRRQPGTKGSDAAGVVAEAEAELDAPFAFAFLGGAMDLSDTTAGGG
jgi:hypothetical protein